MQTPLLILMGGYVMSKFRDVTEYEHVKKLILKNIEDMTEELIYYHDGVTPVGEFIKNLDALIVIRNGLFDQTDVLEERLGLNV